MARKWGMKFIDSKKKTMRDALAPMREICNPEY